MTTKRGQFEIGGIRMKVIKAVKTIDEYFIGLSDEGTVSDRLFFYGTYATCLLITAIAIF